jgi:hypothetical protein
VPNQNDYLGTPGRVPGAAQESRTPGLEPTQNGVPDANKGEADFPWEMIGLGLEEPLPPQDVMDEL